MVLSRKRPKGVRYYAPFGLSVLMMSLMPRSIGYQDLVALMARQTEVPQRARAHMMASPFGTIHAATFSFPQPVGTHDSRAAVYQLASIGTYDPETTGALGGDPSGQCTQPPAARFPGGQPQAQGRSPGDAATRGRNTSSRHPRSDARPRQDRIVPRPADPNAGDANPSEVPIAEQPAPYAVASLQPEIPAKAPLADSEGENDAAVRLGRLYFGNSIGEGVGTIQPWPADEEVLIEAPPAHDPDFKRSALVSPLAEDFNFETTSAAPEPEAAAAPGETVAAKGEVTGAGKRPKTPAERLNLDAKQRAKSEKCLAEAVYFESRGEVKRGQIAVAQVVMNRMFSGFYPNNVCGVVYQNSHRKLACQFTFACDGIPDKIEEPDMWEQAKEIARDMLDGKLWLPEIGHSTHYHAYWVHPSWVNEMRKIHKIGVHSFYRPRRWGDTVEVPNHPFVAPQAKM